MSHEIYNDSSTSALPHLPVTHYTCRGQQRAQVTPAGSYSRPITLYPNMSTQVTAIHALYPHTHGTQHTEHDRAEPAGEAPGQVVHVELHWLRALGRFHVGTGTIPNSHRDPGTPTDSPATQGGPTVYRTRPLR